MSAPINPNDFKAVIADPSQSLCGNFVNTILKSPVLLYKLVNWLLNTDGSATTDAIATFSPVVPGDLIFSASPVASSRTDQSTGPTAGASDRLLCDGRVVSRTVYAVLYSAIGTVYGVGDGSTTFQIPNYQDKFPVGGGALYPLGGTGGAKEQTLVAAMIPSHSHQVGTGAGVAGAAPQYIGVTASGTGDAINTPATHAVNSSSYGGTGDTTPPTPVPTIPPYVGVYIYIKT